MQVYKQILLLRTPCVNMRHHGLRVDTYAMVAVEGVANHRGILKPVASASFTFKVGSRVVVGSKVNSLRVLVCLRCACLLHCVFVTIGFALMQTAGVFNA